MDCDLLILLAIKIILGKKKRQNRRWAVRPAHRDRAQGGYYHKVFKTITSIDPEMFFSHTRMQPKIYMLLLGFMKSRFSGKGRRISANERLSLTVSYLAHGVPLAYLALSYKLGRSTVQQIILETCTALWELLSPAYVSEPTKSQYKDISADFHSLWNMPNCFGAIDGKHIAIKCTKQPVSMFFNYKIFFSIVLMAACDAKYTFTFASVGSYGSESDGGIFRVSDFGKSLLDETFPLPLDRPLPNCASLTFPHYFVADAAFPLNRNIMRPYPVANFTHSRRIFNYRLSRARRMIENAFGILTSRWRVLRTTLEWSPTNSEAIVLACIALHNFIMMHDQQRWYCGEKYTDWEGPDHTMHAGDWRIETNEEAGYLPSVRSFARRARSNAFEMRDQLVNYFCNEGQVSFQEEMIHR